MPQGGETGEITSFRESPRLQPPMFDKIKGLRMPKDGFGDQREFKGYQNPKEDAEKFDATKLAGNAPRWWRLVKPSKGIRNWHAIGSAFRLQFISEAGSQAMRDEFRNLV